MGGTAWVGDFVRPSPYPEPAREPGIGERLDDGVVATHADGQDATRVIIMDGQGAYEGPTLVAEVSLSGEIWDWHGYILDGGLRPAPTSELPE